MLQTSSTHTRLTEILRLGRSRMTNLGRMPWDDGWRILAETRGYPRRIELAGHIVRDGNPLELARRLGELIRECRAPDPYARRDAFPLCLRHVGWCLRCHGS